MTGAEPEILSRSEKRIPGGTQLLSKQSGQFSRRLWPSHFKKAAGSRVWDYNGRMLLDMSLGGIGANVLGYADPDVNNAVKQAIDDGVSSTLNCLEELELADMLIDLHSWADQVRFTRSGGEAMAVAVRIARAASGKEKIAFCGYHGWHDWYLAANLENDNLDEHLLPGLIPLGIPKGLAGTAIPFRYNDLESLERIVSKSGKELGAIVLEPTRSCEPAPGFLERVREISQVNGIPLIFDEISAGFRISKGGSHLKFRVQPDIAVFAKALGNGFPIAAVIGVGDVMESATRTFISSTNWTERTGPAAAIATIRKFLKNNVHEHLIYLGERVQNGWKCISENTGIKIAISGIPPLSHYSFKDAKNSRQMKQFVVEKMLEHNILASNSFYPMYSHTDEDIDFYLEHLHEVFSELSTHIAEDKLDKLASLEGASSGIRKFT